jgi:sialate O-acetylesterase
MKTIINSFIMLVLLTVMSAVSAEAKVELPPIFADNMVLQQNADAAVWGKAKPDAKVVITTTWSKDKTVAQADAEGKWNASVATPSAGGPYEITFSDGEKTVLKNVLIGEVWICSGQSNMEMPMKGFAGQPTDGSAELIMGAKKSTLIRSCKVKRNPSFEVQYEGPATWYDHTPEGVAEASATAYFFAKRLYETLDIPIGIINVSWGGSTIEAWMSKELIGKEFDGCFKMDAHQTKQMPKNPHQTVALLYNGMLKPLVPFTAKGFIWYQGCSNRNQYELYKGLQTSFVKMLRQEWGNENMPFYFTQIAPYQYENPNGVTGGYMMWAQAQTLDMIPNSGMAVTHDAGELVCIHPANKQVVGDRLAYQALYNDYGVKGFNPKAPLARKFEFKDGVAYVTIEVDDLGLSPINMQLEGFELAGADKVFYPAKASVTKNRKIIKVECPEVTDPVAVRYGMKNWSEATLFNCFGIPVSPFRSDDWK